MINKLPTYILCLIFCIYAGFEARAQKNFSKDANAAFERGEYFASIVMYKKAYSKEQNNDAKAEIIFKIGESYRKINDTKQAEIWYKKTIQVRYKDPIAILYLADMKKANGKYDEALIEYRNYTERIPDDPRGRNGSKSCEMVQSWKDNPGRYEVNNEVMLNSPASDFSPIFSKKGNSEIIFTSSREGATGTEVDNTTGQNYTDLWTAKVDRKGKWSTPALLDENINSQENEGAGTFDKGYKQMYFTRCPIVKDKKMGCNILVAGKKGKSFEKPVMIKLASDSFTVGHPSVYMPGRKSDDGDMLFFASDMEGGYGGRDIWISTYKKTGKEGEWQPPVNAGNTINTSGDEMFPHIREDGKTLYFSSNGHIGMGGLDILMAIRNNDGSWGEVENLKYPINSEGDDFGITFEGSFDRGYFTSNRQGGKGDDDIYRFESEQLSFTLQGVVTDAATKAILSGAGVLLTGDDGSSVEEKTDEVGAYFFELKPKVNYSITASKEKYLSENGKETTVGLEKSTDLVHDFELKSTKKPIELPNILYDLDKWDLRPESKSALDGLIATLEENPNIVIRIMSHTDSRAEDKYNLELSQKRAQSVVDYLIERGVVSDRLEAKGYGESKPLLNDSKIKKMATEEEQEAAHQKNRRTEFEVIRADYVPVKKGGYLKVEPPK